MTDYYKLPQFKTFDSPVVQLQEFDKKLLVKLENGKYYMTLDNGIWKEFYFISVVEYEVLNKR